SDGQQCQQAPVKWIVQSRSQSSAPCLIPVKSSNNVASKILKTLADMKNVEDNSANILPLCSSSSAGSQRKITSVKDNALVMYNGKVYLLTNRGSDVLTAQADKQAISSDASLRKEASKLMDSNAVTKITSKVVNLVLSKNKGVVLSQKDLKMCLNSEVASAADLRKDLKSAPAVPVTPSTDQQNSTVNQDKSLPITQSISSGVTPITKVGTQKNVCQNDKEKSPSPKAATSALPHSKQKSAFGEECQKVTVSNKMCQLPYIPGCIRIKQILCSSKPGKVIQIKHQEKPHWKQYMELRKKFGLSKEERVYLRRIPLKTSCEISEGVMMLTLTAACVCFLAVQIIVDLEEDLSKKRKLKSSPLSDTGKRRKTSVRSTTSTNPDKSSPSSVVLNESVSPPPVLVQQSISTGSVLSPLGRESEQDPCSQNSDITDSSIPILVSCENDVSAIEGSFRDDTFPLTPPDLDETIRDEKIKRLKQLLREREAALEEMRRK
ncbi:Ligand-dependent nuclear receptor-interacting factor 1, partial [Tinamus guttatus]